MRRRFQVALGLAIFAAVWLNAVIVRQSEIQAAGGRLPMPPKPGRFYRRKGERG